MSEHAYAQYDIADQQSVVPLPDALTDQPFPAEPLACALNVFHRSHIQPGHRVAVIGIGFLVLLVRLATQAGADVLAISRRPFALSLAQQLGAHHVLPFTPQTLQQATTLSDGQLFDVVIEAVGQQSPLTLAGELTRERGRLVIAGYHQDGPRQINMQLWNWRGIDVINAHERSPAVYTQGMRRAITAVLERTLEPAPLYTHRFPLADVAQAMETARTRPDGFLKALIMM